MGDQKAKGTKKKTAEKGMRSTPSTEQNAKKRKNLIQPPKEDTSYWLQKEGLRGRPARRRTKEMSSYFQILTF